VRGYIEGTDHKTDQAEYSSTMRELTNWHRAARLAFSHCPGPIGLRGATTRRFCQIATARPGFRQRGKALDDLSGFFPPSPTLRDWPGFSQVVVLQRRD
jgi:hypothetical protein